MLKIWNVLTKIVGTIVIIGGSLLIIVLVVDELLKIPISKLEIEDDEDVQYTEYDNDNLYN